MPLVSVILPTHNRASLLGEAIESIRAQTLEDWELIVVDDGSSDQTPEIIAEAQRSDSRIRSVRNNPNLRLPKSLNVGFGMATGDLLTWTSDDNMYRPHALKTLVRNLQETSHGLVYSSMKIVDDDLNPLRDWVAQPVEAQPILPWCGACFLYTRAVCEQVGHYDPERFLAEDLDYWIRVRKHFTMGAISEDLYLYREHATSLSSTRTAEVRLQSARVVMDHLSEARWLTRRTYGETCLGLAEAALSRRDLTDLRIWLRPALLRCPDLVIKHFKRGLLAALTGSIKPE